MHVGMPKGVSSKATKTGFVELLSQLDADRDAISRVLKMETDFRRRIASHVESLPAQDAVFSKFNTNPFVLLIHAMKEKYVYVRQLERDILPAKMFSSMETSAGRMVEQVVLPVYGWECVPSAMHTSESVIDGKQKSDVKLRLATLKSGPRAAIDEIIGLLTVALASSDDAPKNP